MLVLLLSIVSLGSCQHTQPPGVKATSDTDHLSFPWSRLRLPRCVYKNWTALKGKLSLLLSSVFVIQVNDKVTPSYLQVHCSPSLPALAASQSHNAQFQGLCADSDWRAKQHKLGCIAQQGIGNCQGHHTGSGLRTCIWQGNWKYRRGTVFFISCWLGY